MQKAKQNIVNELIEQGFTVEEIQKCYERYVWSNNYYEPKLKEANDWIKFLYEMVNPSDLSDEQKRIIEDFIR